MVVVRNVDAGKQGCSGLQLTARQVCLNTSPYQTDINEDGLFDPEILEELETNVVKDENTEKMEILQRLEADYEEEKKN